MINGKFEVIESLLDFERRWDELLKNTIFYDFESLINKFMTEMQIFRKEDGSFYNVSGFLTPYEIHSITTLDKKIVHDKLMAFLHKINDEVLKFPKLHDGSLFYNIGEKKVLSRTPAKGNEP